MYKCATEEAELISNSAYLTLGQSIKLDTVPDFVCVAIDSEANDLELLLQECRGSAKSTHTQHIPS